MTIAQVSRRYGLSADTLRYYERVGILPPVGRTPSGRRDYTPNDCGWIELACCMRAAGLPVESLADYVRLTLQGDDTIPARRQLLLAQRQRLQARQQALKDALDKLDCKIARYDEALVAGHLDWQSDGGHPPLP